MKPGDQIVLEGGSHMAPDGWTVGQKPIFINKDTLALVLSEETEPDVADPRVFLRVLCTLGIGKVNRDWCRRLDESSAYGIAFTDDGGPVGRTVGWKTSPNGRVMLWDNRDDALRANDTIGWTGYVRKYVGERRCSRRKPTTREGDK